MTTRYRSVTLAHKINYTGATMIYTDTSEAGTPGSEGFIATVRRLSFIAWASFAVAGVYAAYLGIVT